MEFKNKVVLITGGTRGIGRELVKAFADQGATVIFIYNKSHDLAHSLIDEIKNSSQSYTEYKDNNPTCNPEQSETEPVDLKLCNDNKELYCEIIKPDIDIVAVQCDVSDYNQVHNILGDIIKAYPKIDVLINNAGISYYGLLTDMSVEDWHNIIDTNMNSLFYVTREVLPNMINNKSGSIINISSIWGIDGAACEVAYSASKGGLNAFTKALSKEVGPSNIRVNAIAPGYVDTDMNKNLTPEEKQEFINAVSLMKGGTPKDIAELCLYVASDAAKYMTGQIIRLDGGM